MFAWTVNISILWFLFTVFLGNNLFFFFLTMYKELEQINRNLEKWTIFTIVQGKNGLVVVNYMVGMMDRIFIIILEFLNDTR